MMGKMRWCKSKNFVPGKMLPWRKMVFLFFLAFFSAASAAPGAQAVQVRSWSPAVTGLALKSDVPILVQRAFGGQADDAAFAAVKTHDGGFVVTGSTKSSGAGKADLLVLKLDGKGNVLWAKTYGGPEDDIGFGIQQTRDGGYAVVGSTKSFGAGKEDIWFLRLDQKGNLLYQRTLGGTGNDCGFGLTLTRDGGFALVGETYSYGAGDSRFYFAKLDARGSVQLERTYDDGPLNERGLAILEEHDGYLLIGNSMNATSGSAATISDGYAVRIDVQGNALWSRRYGTQKHDIFHSVVRLKSGQTLVSGYTESYGSKGQNDVWTLFLGPNGDVQHQDVFGGPLDDHNIIATPLSDGGAYLGGYSQSWGAGDFDAQVLKLSAQGDVEWHHEFGGSKSDGAIAVFPAGPGKAALIGFTDSEGAGGRDIFFCVLKVGPSNIR